MRHDGGLLIAFGAALGFVASVYNYFAAAPLFAPTSAIAGTPGALVPIATTAILFMAGLVLAGTAAGPLLAALLIVGTLAGILGTALAGWLLESQLLVALMLLCFIGWLMRVLTRRPVYR